MTSDKVREALAPISRYMVPDALVPVDEKTTAALLNAVNVLFNERQSAQAQTVPDDYVLVPKEPTSKMVEAAQFERFDDAKYRAMLSAAPTSVGPTQGDKE